MKKRFVAAIIGLFSFTVNADVAEGRWVTIDDEDGSQASVVEIKIAENGQLQGTIVELLRDKDKGKRCEECPDEFHNQPIKGLTFMWGLKKEEEGEWESGRILDPKSGSVYKSKLKVSEDGKTMEVRGYIGVSWLGRSQQWMRYQAPAETSMLDKAKAKMSQLTETAGNIVKQATQNEDVNNALSSAKEAAQDVYSEAKEAAQDAVQQGKESAKDAFNKAKAAISKD